MDQAAREDAHGLEALYAVHRPELLRFLIARTGDRAEAEDLLQELWIKVRLPCGAPVANGRAYLYRMAHNLALDRARESHRRQCRDRRWCDEKTGFAAAEPRDACPTAQDEMLAREEIALLVSALANLPDGARRAIELHKIQGLSHGEVVARLNISKSGVEKHMAVAMKYLRRALLD